MYVETLARARCSGDTWMLEDKCRRIRGKLAERFKDAQHCLQHLDRNKSGVLDRREVRVIML
jgi:hypothetical protein